MDCLIYTVFITDIQVAGFKKFLAASVRYEWTGSQCLADDDPEVMAIVCNEKARQKTGLELIASEVICLRYYSGATCAVNQQNLLVYCNRQLLSSCFSKDRMA